VVSVPADDEVLYDNSKLQIVLLPPESSKTPSGEQKLKTFPSPTKRDRTTDVAEP